MYGTVVEADAAEPHRITTLRELDDRRQASAAPSRLTRRSYELRARLGVAAVLGAAVFAAAYGVIGRPTSRARGEVFDSQAAAVAGESGWEGGASSGTESDALGGREHYTLPTTDAGSAWLNAHTIQFTAGGSRQPGATGWPTYKNKSYLFETYYDEAVLVSDVPGDLVDVVVEEDTCNSFFTTRNDTDYGGRATISKIKSGHSDIVTLYEYFDGAPAGIDLVQETGHLYWADKKKGVVYRGCVDGDVDTTCDRIEVVTDVPLVADVSILTDDDNECDKIYMAIPEMGVYRANCNGSHVEEIVSADLGSDAVTVFVHQENDLVYWANKGDVYSANMVSGGDVTLEFNSTDHASLTNGTCIEFITVIDDFLLMSSETMNEIYFMDVSDAAASAGKLLHHHKVHGVTDGYECSITETPSLSPTYEPTVHKTPSVAPTHDPTHPAPTAHKEPSVAPTHDPTHPAPTEYMSPSYAPTVHKEPSVAPTHDPTHPAPTAHKEPSVAPTHEPTHPAPTEHMSPSYAPTVHKEPSVAPTRDLKPTHDPTHDPTHPAPTVHREPSVAPTYDKKPTGSPTHEPTHPAPTAPHPTAAPSHEPTHPAPTHTPTHPAPTEHREPSVEPTISLLPTPVPSSPPKDKDYTFCDSIKDIPSLSVTNGGFHFNGTYKNYTCLAKPTEGSNTNLVHSEYSMYNTTVNVTFVKNDESSGQVMAVALRSTENDDAWGYSYCRGYQKYLCNAQVKSLKKVKLEFKICGTDGTYEDMYSSGYATFEADHAYKLSFTAKGDELNCKLYDEEGETAGAVLLDHTMNSSEVTRIAGDGIIDEAGGAEFGCYSNTQYFRNFDISNHEDNTRLQYF